MVIISAPGAQSYKYISEALEELCLVLYVNAMVYYMVRWNCRWKPLDTEQKLKVHRFTNNIKARDFPCNIIPWNALLFEKTLKQLSILDIKNNRFILNSCHETAKRGETRVGFHVIFSRLSVIEPKFSQVWYLIFKLWYMKCGPLDNTVYRCCAITLAEQYLDNAVDRHTFVQVSGILKYLVSVYLMM